MRKTIGIVLLLVLVGGGGASAWFFLHKTPLQRKTVTSAPVPETEPDGLQKPSFHSERSVAPADSILPQSTPEIAEINPAPIPGAAGCHGKETGTDAHLYLNRC